MKFDLVTYTEEILKMEKFIFCAVKIGRKQRDNLDDY